MVLWDQVEKYRQRILIAHWEAFNCIEHKSTKGRMRERTVSTLLQEEYGISPVSGVVCDDADDWQSPEMDILLLSQKARRGTPGAYHLGDVVATCEVKSFAASKDFNSTEEAAKIIKSHSGGKIMTTLFAFATRAKRKTVCTHFGFPFDSTLKAHRAYQRNQDCYSHLDHFISLDASYEQQPYLITRDITGERALQIGGRPVEQFLKLFQLDCS